MFDNDIPVRTTKHGCNGFERSYFVSISTYTNPGIKTSGKKCINNLERKKKIKIAKKISCKCKAEEFRNTAVR